MHGNCHSLARAQDTQQKATTVVCLCHLCWSESERACMQQRKALLSVIATAAAAAAAVVVVEWFHLFCVFITLIVCE